MSCHLLVDFDSGRVRACVSEDGGGKYDVRVYVSVPRMLMLKRQTYARLCSLRPFPLCTVQLWDATSLAGAYRAVEGAVGDIQ